MKRIKLDSILLFALVIPFVMNYRISPKETSFLLFGLIFLGLLFYICLDLLRIKEKIYYFLKLLVLWFLVVGVIGSAFASAIIVRHQTHPIYMIHDIVLQQESAIRFLLDGKNPYAATYFGTPLEQWHYSEKDINPALYHFVMQPFYLLFALPFYFLSNTTIGYFDGRIPLLFLYLIMLIFAGVLVKNREKKLLFIILLAFNPSVLAHALEGRSDIFMFAFLFFGLYLLHIKKYFVAGIPIALSFAVKQSAWPILPFYFAFLYFHRKRNTTNILRASSALQNESRSLSGSSSRLTSPLSSKRAPSLRSVRLFARTIILLIPFIITFSVIVLPFFLWDQKAFLDSTIFYLSGSTEHSYPVSGYGLGMLLYQMGIIKDVHQYYPFWIWQLIIGMPVLTALILYLKKTPSVGRLILVYGIFLFVFWYLSRYFNNSHLGYLSVVFITAYFWPEE